MTPKIIKYLNFSPYLDTGIVSPSSTIIIGNVFIGSNTKFQENVIVRGDGKEIYIGKNCLLRERTTIHVAGRIQGTKIGDNCVIDEYSIIHACKLGDNVLVGSNCVIMDGSEIGDNVIVANNSLIPPRKKFSSNTLIAGSPAKVIKKIDEKDFLTYKTQLITKNPNSFFMNKFNYRDYLQKAATEKNNINIPNTCFIASDAFIGQSLIMNARASIWYSVSILSSKKNGQVILGEGSNIQDNSIIDTLGNIIKIGKRVTVGHNVIILGKTKIHDDAVIGMGSIIDQGCLIGINSFVGANSYLPPNTSVPANTIFAGKPAKFFRKVKDQEKQYFYEGQKVYEKLVNEYNSLIV